MATKVSSSRRGWGTKLLWATLYVVPLLALAAFGGIYFKKYNDLKNSSPEKIQESQNEQYIASVAKLYSLPKDEKPDIVAVKDKSQIKDQPFFEPAKNGDVALVYTKARLAILYRPGSNKIVNVSTLSVNAGPVIRIIGSQAERQSAQKTLTNNKFTATDGGDAKSTFSGVTVVDLSGKNSEQAKKIADLLKGQVATALPDGEEKPAGIDVLVIVGLPAAP